MNELGKTLVQGSGNGDAIFQAANGLP